jgi:HK97 family phage major capsid protein
MTIELITAAQTNLDAVSKRYSEALDDVESRLSDASTAQEIEALEKSADLDGLKASLASAQARVKSISSISEARAASRHLIPAGDLRVSEPATYDKRNPHISWFSDLYAMRNTGNRDATARLERNHQESLTASEARGDVFRDAEGRAMGSTAGQGGDFLPPIWYGDLYAEFKRARRVTAGLFRNLPLSETGNTISVPKVTGGTSAAAQSADNANVTNVDATTAMITVPVCTVAGYTDCSRQILERSQPGLDQILVQDLLNDYNRRVNLYCVSGLGTGGQPLGLLNTPSITSVSYNDGSPTVARFFPKLVDAVRQVNENVYEPATAIVMTARRWAWILEAVDSTGRPLVVPNGNGPFNEVGTLSSGKDGPFGNNSDSITPAGTLLGLPVYVDETYPKAGGTGTNSDIVVTANFNENILWEDQNGPRSFRFDAIQSQTAAIRLQVFGYVASTCARFPTANSVIQGTGLVSPTF